MFDFDENIIAELKKNPGQVHITSDGKAMYLLAGPDERLIVVWAGTKKFTEMTDDEINAKIVGLLKELN